MIESSRELPDNIDELERLTHANVARADQSEANVQAARGEILKLKAEVSDLAAANATPTAQIARLTSILKALRCRRFGKKPEKLGSDEAKERVKIGEDESFRLDVVRARLRLVVTIRPKCAFKEPAAILQAPAPEHIIEAGLPTEALRAQVAVSKNADGPPLCRQEAIYARDGVELSRSLMAQWMGAVGLHFAPLAAFILARILEGERNFANETTPPTLDPGAGKTKTT